MELTNSGIRRFQGKFVVDFSSLARDITLLIFHTAENPYLSTDRICIVAVKINVL